MDKSNYVLTINEGQSVKCYRGEIEFTLIFAQSAEAEKFVSYFQSAQADCIVNKSRGQSVLKKGISRSNNVIKFYSAANTDSAFPCDENLIFSCFLTDNKEADKAFLILKEALNGTSSFN